MNKHFHSSLNTFPLCCLILYFLPQLRRSTLKITILSSYRNFPSNSLKKKILAPDELAHASLHLRYKKDFQGVIKSAFLHPRSKLFTLSVQDCGAAGNLVGHLVQVPGWSQPLGGWLTQRIPSLGSSSVAISVAISQDKLYLHTWKGHHGHRERRTGARRWFEIYDKYLSNPSHCCFLIPASFCRTLGYPQNSSLLSSHLDNYFLSSPLWHMFYPPYLHFYLSILSPGKLFKIQLQNQNPSVFKIV